MKKPFTLLFAALLSVSMFGQNNLFLNAGFEDEAFDANWNFGVDTKGDAVATNEIVSDAKEASQALHVNVSQLTTNSKDLAKDRFDIRLQQTVELEKGKTYELGFWSKGTAQTTGLEFEIKYGTDGTTKYLLEGTHRFDITADWSYQIVSFTVPADLQVEPNQALISFLFIRTGDFFLDGLSLKSTLVSDGSFEGKSWTNTIREDRGAVATISFVEDDVQDGAVALKAEVEQQGTYVYDITSKTPVGIEADRTFTLTFYAKADVEGASLKCYFPQIFNSTGKAPEFLLTTQWAEYSITLDYTVVKPAKTAEMLFYFHQAGTTYWVDNVNIEYGGSTAIGDIDESIIEPSLYPNPVSDQLNVKSNKPLANADIFDLTGRLVAHHSILNNQVSVQDLKTGTYLIRLTDIKNNNHTLRFIKQ